MNHVASSLRPFIGAKDFEESRRFYKDLGFVESPIAPTMSYFRVTDSLGFYLQNAYVKAWIDNLMLFLEVDDVQRYWEELEQLGLHKRYKNVR